MLVPNFVKPNIFSSLVVVCFVSLLSACGGGGSGNDDRSSTPSVSITLNAIAEDDTISATEAKGAIVVSGSVSGDVEDGDVVTLTVNGNSYEGEVIANTFSVEVPGSELTTATDLTASISSMAGDQELSAETQRSFTVSAPIVSLTLFANLTSDNIINLAESNQDHAITGEAEGDVVDGDTVTVRVGDEDYLGSLSSGSFNIVVPGSVLASNTEFSASITTSTGSSLGEATSEALFEYSVSVEPPQITVIFPWAESAVESSSVNVTALIIDDEEINEVQINDSLAQNITSSNIPELEQALLDYPDSDVMLVQSTVDLTLGSNSILLHVEDNAGNSTNLSDITVSRIVDEPNYIFNDSANNRFIGPTPSVNSNLPSSWVGIDKTSSLISSLTPSDIPNSAHTFDPVSEVIYSIRRSNSGHEISIFSTSLSNDETSLLASFDNSINPEGWSSTGIFDMHINDTNDRLYIMQTLIPPAEGDGAWQPIFYAFNIETTEINVLSSVFDGDDSISSNKFAYGGSYLYVPITARNRSGARELMRIDINDGNKEVVVADLGFSPNEITVDQDNNLAYLVSLGDENVGIVNLNTFSVTALLLTEEDALQYSFPQPRDVLFDGDNNRLLVGDSDLSYVTTIDVTTGKRGSLTNESRVGEGIAIVQPSDLYVASSEEAVYILEGGNAQPEQILNIDVSTGNRTIISSLPTCNSVEKSLSVDESNLLGYVVCNNTIYMVDLSTGDYEIIASNSIGSGTSISTIQEATLTANENELIVAYNQGELLSLNLSTLVRTHLSSTGLGNSIRNFEFDSSENRIFITTNDSGIYNYSISENQTTLLTDYCRYGIFSSWLDPDDNWLTEHGYIKSADYDAENNRLLLGASEYLDTYAVVQLDDLSCTVYPDAYFDDGVFLESGDVLAVQKNKLFKIRFSTQDISILSK